MAREQVPVVTNSTTEPEAPKDKRVSYLSLPHKAQLVILCIARLVDPLAQSSIQSYMFYQLKFFNPSASDASISTQAGILVGAKTAAQVCTGMLWGRLADSDLGGRKAVLFIGLTSCCIAYVGYGLSRSFPAAVAWQVFGGAMNNNVAVIRCVVAELNPEKRHRARALLLLPLFANAGMLFGPLVGGLLSSNSKGGAGSTYPYLAPNLLVAAAYLIAAIGVFFFLTETLESLQHTEEHELQRLWRRIKQYFSKNNSKQHHYAAIDQDEPDSPTTPLEEFSPNPPSASNAAPLINNSPKRKRKLPFYRIWTFNVVCTMLSHFIIAGHLGTFSNLWAIFLTTPVAKPEERSPPFKFSGGLGMIPRDVGFALSLLGAIGVVLQLVVYPKLQDRFGTIKVWRTALFIFPLVYILAPFPSLVASAQSLNAKTAFVWISMSSVLLLFVLGRTGVTPATTLLINDCAPHPSVRGTIHAAATVIGNLSRSFFPVAAFAIFGEGLNIGVVGLGFWCLAGLAILACVASRWVVEGSNGKEIVLEDNDEEERIENYTPRQNVTIRLNNTLDSSFFPICALSTTLIALTNNILYLGNITDAFFPPSSPTPSAFPTHDLTVLGSAEQYRFYNPAVNASHCTRLPDFAGAEPTPGACFF
ncbi:MFS general substrate transporter [Lepidopterella palustris CBS 459.81]|uniref:MFS general substrate transporter n=1 Tax=Lepidopterella palustris CBS 459.81 TaxID=1314670 RepID=A0A8E2E815_9PEZI|nr:MFS general substrate transporter [Lepidopterella palustris CBS 459.81]